jgi:hypothetical protein
MMAISTLGAFAIPVLLLCVLRMLWLAHRGWSDWLDLAEMFALAGLIGAVGFHRGGLALALLYAPLTATPLTVMYWLYAEKSEKKGGSN